MAGPRGQTDPFALSVVLAALPWPALALDAGNAVRFANPACRDAFGDVALVGQTLSAIAAPWNTPELRAALAAWSEDEPGAREVAVRLPQSLRVVVAPLPACDLGADCRLLCIVDRRAHGRLELQMRELNERLEAALSRRTAQVHEQATQLRELTGELLEAEARERARLAETLHDHLQQLLVAAQMRLHALDKHPPAERAAALGADVRRLLQDAIDLSRSLAIELSPPLPHGDGLMSGLRWLAQHFRQQHDLAVAIHLESPPPDLPTALQAFLFRAARELLFNVVKHAGVKEASLTVRGGPGPRIYFAVEDAGPGCPLLDNDLPARVGFGLAVIRQRAVALGGHCHIEQPAAGGCRISIELPLTANG